jgi:hypothetical protein
MLEHIADSALLRRKVDVPLRVKQNAIAKRYMPFIRPQNARDTL